MDSDEKSLQKVIALTKCKDISQREKLVAFEQFFREVSPPHFGRVDYVKFLISEGMHGRALKELDNLTESGHASFESYFYAGVCFDALNKEKNALGCWLMALEKSPQHAVCLSNVGSIFLKAGQLNKAEKKYLDAHGSAPQFAAPIAGLVKVYTELKKFDKAVEFQMKLIRLKEEPSKFVTLANLLMKNGEFNKAKKILLAVQATYPDEAVVANALGGVYYRFAQLELALEWFRKATELAPGYAAAVANYLLCLNYTHAPLEFIKAEHLRFGRALASTDSDRTPSVSMTDTKPVLGFVSPDFFQHPVGQLFEPVLQCLNNSQNSIYLYYTANTKDDLTKRLMESFGRRFVMCEGLSDELLRRRIAADGVNVLFDLSGHTSGHRLSLFAKRAAPVQVSYLGYPNTTGVPAMDYRLVDYFTDPEPDADRLVSEKLVRMPPPFLNMSAPRVNLPVVKTPSLHRQEFVFGCFNNLAKLSDSVLQTWGKILSSIVESRLILKAPSFADAEICNFQIERMSRCGIPIEKVNLNARMGYADHLKLYNEVDLGLDPFPYNGTATTNESLWMGVPVVVLEGSSHVSRVGFSLNRSLGLDQFIARNESEYIQICKYWSENRAALNEVRMGLRDRIRTSGAGNPEVCAKKIENAVTEMLSLTPK